MSPGITSNRAPTYIALDEQSYNYSNLSLDEQVSLVATLFHELAHVVFTENFWAVFSTDPLYYANLIICHAAGEGAGNTAYGPCDEAYAYSKEAEGLCNSMRALLDAGKGPYSKEVKKLGASYEQAVKNCTEANTACQNKNATCGAMPMPPDFGGCPGTTCNG